MRVQDEGGNAAHAIFDGREEVHDLSTEVGWEPGEVG